jgi:hypothetical protein
MEEVLRYLQHGTQISTSTGAPNSPLIDNAHRISFAGGNGLTLRMNVCICATSQTYGDFPLGRLQMTATIPA